MVAQDRVGPTGEDRSHPSTTLGQDPVSHRVDASVEEMQAACCDGTINRPRLNPELDQLPTRHHAVLSLSEDSNRFVSPVRSQFTPHTGVKCDLTKSLPPLGVPC